MRFAEVLPKIRFIWLRYRSVVGIFILSQIVFILSVWIGSLFVPAAYPAVSTDDQEFGLFVSSHFRWDTINYITIAREGYHAPVDQGVGKLPAFFPLFPLCVRLVAELLGLSSILAYAWVMIILNLLLCLGAFILIYNLAEEAGLDSPTSKRAVLFLAIFPFAVFLVVPYSEAFYLFLSAIFFLLVFKGKWIWAGVVGGLLSATRMPGVLFSILLILKFTITFKNNGLTPKELLRGIIAIVLSLSGLAFFMVYLQVTFGDLLAFLHAQSYWKRDLQIPFVTLWRGLVYALNPGQTEFLDQYLINTVHTIFIVLFIVVMIASLRRWNWLYHVYAWLLFCVSLVSPLQGSGTMQSTARYMMVLFPVFFTLAQWGRKAWVRMTIFAVWLLLFSLMAALLGRGWLVG